MIYLNLQVNGTYVLLSQVNITKFNLCSASVFNKHVAQLFEHLTGNQKLLGSIPIRESENFFKKLMSAFLNHKK